MQDRNSEMMASVCTNLRALTGKEGPVSDKLGVFSIQQLAEGGGSWSENSDDIYTDDIRYNTIGPTGVLFCIVYCIVGLDLRWEIMLDSRHSLSYLISRPSGEVGQ